MRESCLLSIIEDVQEPDSYLTSKDDLLHISYLLEELGQDEDHLDETQMLAEALYA